MQWNDKLLSTGLSLICRVYEYNHVQIIIIQGMTLYIAMTLVCVDKSLVMTKNDAQCKSLKSNQHESMSSS